MDSDLIASLPSKLRQTGLQQGLRAFNLPLEIPSYSYGLVWHQRTDSALGHSWLRGTIVRASHA